MILMPATRLFLALFFSTFILAPVALAAEGSATIIAPKDGDILDLMAQNKIVYEVDPGPRGDHIHAYIDGKEVGILRQLKGSYTLETLTEGKHELCIKVVNKAHVPIGIGSCVNVTVE